MNSFSEGFLTHIWEEISTETYLLLEKVGKVEWIPITVCNQWIVYHPQMMSFRVCITEQTENLIKKGYRLFLSPHSVFYWSVNINHAKCFFTVAKPTRICWILLSKQLWVNSSNRNLGLISIKTVLSGHNWQIHFCHLSVWMDLCWMEGIF